MRRMLTIIRINETRGYVEPPCARETRTRRAPRGLLCGSLKVYGELGKS